MGTGPQSSTAIFYSCQKPEGIAAPTVFSVSKTSIGIKWTSPADDGGCPITSYSILRDGGPADPVFVEVHSADVNNKPTLQSFVVTDLPPLIVGQPLKFKVQATN